MVNVALVVRLVAKAGQEEQLRSFLAGAQRMAQQESFTPVWLALRTERSVFYIVDAFANNGDRDKHLAGDIAKALMASATELLGEPPKIEKADVLGAKYQDLEDPGKASDDDEKREEYEGGKPGPHGKK